MTIRRTWWFVPSIGLTFLLTANAFAQAQDAAEAPPPAPKAQPPLEDNPLLSEPRTPQTLMDAVVLMTDLARPGLAKMYLEKLLESNPDDETLLKLRDKHGPAMFLRLSNDKRLQPESITLLEQVNAAFRKGATDPVRVDKLIGDLRKTATEREVAILQLRNAGNYGAARLIAALNVSRDDAQRKLMLYTLTRLNREVVPALLGAVEGPNQDMRSTVIEALGWLGQPQAIGALWHPAFGEAQPPAVQLAARQALARLLFGTVKRVGEVSQFGAAAELVKFARRNLRGEGDWSLNDDEQVELWNWDEAAGTVTMTPVTVETASIRAALRQARQAFELAPNRSDLHALYWTALMANELQDAERGAAISTRPGSTFHVGLQLGPDVMQTALVEAMSLGEPIVATIALQTLAQTGSARMFKATESRPAPVVAALNYPDSRVQFAAASTILTWDPPTTFRGASRVVEVLARALTDAGTARGVAIDANEQRATSMSAALREMGFEPDMAQTGQDGFKIAAERGDVGLFLIEANVARWELSQTVANIRSDARTAYIPIVIYGDEKLQTRIERIAESQPHVRFVLQTSDATLMSKQVLRFLRAANANTITQPQRAATRQAALTWLVQLADRRQASLFDLRPAENALLTATNEPKLGESAVFALGAIATPTAQAKLFEIGAAASRPAPVRERALAMLAAHMQRHGVMLTELQTDELRKAARQETDPQLQTAFASTLGSLSPDLMRASEVLKAVQPRHEKPAE
ncbi:MAG: HEAT repeat domain-containing protein [Planctomycetaceae bacterium]|nr:HEAT repeat domain-containing protein [Planctomycetaceae bacterium]